MCKNLFLKDKKKNSLWLVVAHKDTNVDMKKLTKNLGFQSGTLRFAAEEILQKTLGVSQGSVTPLALLNDREKHIVHVIIDELLLKDDNQELLFHPLSNDYTTELTAGELKLLLKNFGHPFTVTNFA